MLLQKLQKASDSPRVICFDVVRASIGETRGLGSEALISPSRSPVEALYAKLEFGSHPRSSQDLVKMSTLGILIKCGGIRDKHFPWKKGHQLHAVSKLGMKKVVMKLLLLQGL